MIDEKTANTTAWLHAVASLDKIQSGEADTARDTIAAIARYDYGNSAMNPAAID